MLEGYDGWFRDVGGSRDFQPPRIHLGSPGEDPARLTRQDWRGEVTEWQPGSLGGWEVEVIRPGKYDLEVLFALGAAGVVGVELNGVTERREVGPESRSCRIEGFEFRPGRGRLQARVERPSATVGAHQVVIRRRPE